jgi:uncharacterized surface protein with fasciclin (FAS1) repeats
VTNINQRHALAGAVIVLALIAAGCGGANKAAEAPAPANADSQAEANPQAAEQSDTSVATTASGPACSLLPQGNATGGLQAMSTQPAGTAASTNPQLTTLVKAVQQAGLVDTLNGPGPFTIFAPVNDAFAKVPTTDFNALLADKTKLTKTLDYHIHSGEVLTTDKLASMSTLKMADNGNVSLTRSGDTLGLNGQAKIVCGNIKVGNGVVHLIDTVLTPGS